MISLRSIAAPVSVVLVAGLALAGCGSLDALQVGSSAKTGQSAEATAAPLSKENFAERISAAQLKAGSVHVSMQVPGGIGTTEGSIQLSADPSQIRGAITVQSPDGNFELRIVDGTVYTNMGELTQNKFIDLAQTPTGDQVAGSLTQVNPEEQLKGFNEALQSFSSEPGTEKIDGVSVTKVALVLNTQKLLAAHPAMQEQAAAAADLLGETMEYVMYVGADDLPRRITSPGFAGSEGFNVDYTQWGEQVSVAAPTADELLDVAALGIPGM